MDKNDNNKKFKLSSDISTSLSNAKEKTHADKEQLDEECETLKRITPECDKTDYILAVSSGILCGFLDVFLISKPGESIFGNITDEWFENRTKDFAKRFGWDSAKNNTSVSAIKFLEKKFKIPYDQHGAGDAASAVFDLNPKNHHFKSLAHNPTILGLFYSILDQFNNTSHFVSGEELISLQNADGRFELRGNNPLSKVFCAFVNWIGHLISDTAGSSSSKGRGMGIPSPIWAWVNDIIVFKRKLNIPNTDFERVLTELALQLYNKGYDIRFQTAQAIPVFINDMLVRLFYTIRRTIRFLSNSQKDKFSFKNLWKECKPFSNATVGRMLTVAHGSFCMIDMGDALVKGLNSKGNKFDVINFFLNLNTPGLGRFAFSLFGEIKYKAKRITTIKNVCSQKRENSGLSDFIERLTPIANYC